METIVLLAVLLSANPSNNAYMAATAPSWDSCVKQAGALVKAAPVQKGDEVHTMCWDTKTGRIEEVVTKGKASVVTYL